MDALIASLLVAAAGYGVLAYVKWWARQAPSRADRRQPAPGSWQAVGFELARAVSPLSATVEAVLDENGVEAAVVLVYGVNRTLKLRSTGRTMGDVETGHLGFDRQLWAQGNTDFVRALLDGPTRDAILHLLRGPLRGGQLVVEAGELRAVLPAGASLDDAVPLITRVAQRLAARIDVPSELAKNARSDSVSGVRLLCLRTLLREHPNDASIVNPMLRAAVGDEDAEVRLEAAMALGPEGEPTLQALVADASVEDGLAARAAVALGDRMPAHVARATLWRELAEFSSRRRLATACACAHALGLGGEAQDEDLLLRALPEDRDEALRLAAARALGAVGSVGAVPSLADLSSSDGAELRRAGREAIAAIQSRLQGATPGQLSLGTGDSGQVSLADDVAGRLSDPGPSDR